MISLQIGNVNPFYTILLKFLGSNQLDKKCQTRLQFSNFKTQNGTSTHVSIDLSLVSFFYLPTTLSSLEIARL